MAQLSTQQIGVGGVKPVMSPASAGGDTFGPDARTFLDVTNGGGSAITVTITTYGTGPGGNPVANRVISIPAGEERMIGPFDPAGFADANGNAAVSYSAVATVTVAALRL